MKNVSAEESECIQTQKIEYAVIFSTDCYTHRAVEVSIIDVQSPYKRVFDGPNNVLMNVCHLSPMSSHFSTL